MRLSDGRLCVRRVDDVRPGVVRGATEQRGGGWTAQQPNTLTHDWPRKIANTSLPRLRFS
jgi:hypothetical protein